MKEPVIKSFSFKQSLIRGFVLSPLAAPLVLTLVLILFRANEDLLMWVESLALIFLVGAAISYASMFTLGSLVICILCWAKCLNTVTVFVSSAIAGAFTMWLLSGTGHMYNISLEAMGLGAIFGVINSLAFSWIARLPFYGKGV